MPIIVAAGVLTGLWAYGDLDSVAFWGRPFLERLGYSTAFQIGLLALLVLVGFVVRRWWALACLLGPLISLGLAQANGERGFDGSAPLTSPPGVSRFLWFGACLLIGVWLGRSWERRRGVPATRVS